jgi:hypothetical protein
MKKIFLGLILFVAVFTIQLNIVTTKAGSDVSLDQLVQKADACIEIGGQNYQCCYAPNSWCYIGGGYEISPFFFSF